MVSLFWQIGRWMPFHSKPGIFFFLYINFTHTMCSGLFWFFFLPSVIVLHSFANFYTGCFLCYCLSIHFIFAFPVLSNFILSLQVIGTEVLQYRPFLRNLKKKQWEMISESEKVLPIISELTKKGSLKEPVVLEEFGKMVFWFKIKLPCFGNGPVEFNWE